MKHIEKREKRKIDLGIEHKGTEDTGGGHGGVEVRKGFLVILMGAMGEVEPGDIQSGPQELLEHGHRSTGGA